MTEATQALSITDAFDDYDSMKVLLSTIGISVSCIERLMDEEGYETARDLATSTDFDIKTTIDNVNKLFGSADA